MSFDLPRNLNQSTKLTNLKKMLHNSLPQKRVVLKKKPLFDEKGYRQEFYDTVLKVQPLFTEFTEVFSETLIPTQPTNDLAATQICSELAMSVKLWIKRTLDKKIEELRSQDNSFCPDCDIIIKSLENSLEKIKELLHATNQSMINLLHQGIQADIVGIRKGLLDLLHEIYYILQHYPDQFSSSYEIDSYHCLNVLYQNNPQQPITEAVYLNQSRYEDIVGKLDKSPQKNQPKAQKIATPSNPEELLSICKEKLHNVKGILLLAESKVKKKIFLDNGPQIIGDNIFSDIIEKVKQIESQGGSIDHQESRIMLEYLQTLKENPMAGQIVKFSEEKKGKYMSTQSISDYERYMDSFVESANGTLQHLGNEERKVIRMILRNSVVGTQPIKNEQKGIKFFFSEEYLFSKVQKILSENLKLGPLEGVLSSEDEFTKLSKIKITFLPTKLWEIEANFKPDATALPYTAVYHCSLTDGINFMRIAPLNPEGIKVENFTQMSHCSSFRNVRCKQILAEQQLNSAFEELMTYVSFRNYNSDQYNIPTNQLKARLLIMGYEELIKVSGNEEHDQISLEKFQQYLNSLKKKKKIIIMDATTEDDKNNEEQKSGKIEPRRGDEDSTSLMLESLTSKSGQPGSKKITILNDSPSMRIEDQLSQLKAENERLKQEIIDYKEQIENLNFEKIHWMQQNSKKQTEINNMQSLISEIANENEKSHSSPLKSGTKVEKIIKNFEKEKKSLIAQIQNEKAKYDEKIKAMVKCESEKRELMVTNNELEELREGLEKANKLLYEETESLKVAIKNLEEKISTLEINCDSFQKKYDIVAMEKAELQAKLNTLLGPKG